MRYMKITVLSILVLYLDVKSKYSTKMVIHSNLSYPGSARPEGARKSEFARISENHYIINGKVGIFNQ